MTSSILSVKNIHKVYHLSNLLSSRGWITAVDDISFDLQAGQTLAVVGESGSGKSTLARQLVGAEQPTSGSIFIDGVNLNKLSARQRAKMFRQVRMVFQNPASSLNPHSRVGNILQEPLKINTRLSAQERTALVNETLQKVGLRSEHTSRFPHMFSGGQQQRIAIARALILQPKVIVADEPLSALDVSIQAQILNLLMSLQEQLDIAYVFISHDLGVVEHISDNVLVMYRGKIMEYGSVDQIFDHPKHPYTRKLLSSTPSYRQKISFNRKGPALKLSKKEKEKAKCPFVERCPYAKKDCVEVEPKIQSFDGQRVFCHWPLEDL